MKGRVRPSAAMLTGGTNFKIPIQEVELAMMVFNTPYGFTRWSAYFSLCFWRMRLKVSRIGA